MKDSFVFYRSFYDGIKELNVEERDKVYTAIFEYQFDGIEIELTGIEKAIFSLIKPQLDANNLRFENGCKGGRPKKEKTNGYETKKPMVLKNSKIKKPNVNDNENVNVNDNVTAIAVKEKSDSCGDGSVQSDSCGDEIVNFFNQNIGMITPHEFEILNSYRSDFSDDIIVYALQLQVEKRATGVAYAKAILNSWKKKNIKTLHEAQNENKHPKAGEENKDLQKFHSMNSQYQDLDKFYANL